MHVSTHPIAPPRRVDLRREFIAGLTTFLTLSYIIVVNPAILSTEGTGMPFSGVLTATVLLSFLMTLFMGLYARLPYAVAPGMGINAFFTYTVIIKDQVPWPVALGVVFWAGVLFLLISLTPLRESLARAIPKHLRVGASVGIGIFLCFIGLKNSGWIVADPVTLVKGAPVSAMSVLSAVGVLLGGWLLARKNPVALLLPIVLVTLGAAFLGQISAPAQLVSWPDFDSVFLKMDLVGSFKLALVPVILAFCLTDLFDSISTFVGVANATGLVDENGEPKNMRQGLIVDAFATLGGGLVGTSSGTAYIESAAGIEAGGRTGWTAVFTAICFLPCFFLAPLIGLVPAAATAPVLILVGALMFRSVFETRIKNIEDLVPAFMVMILIPLTFSITQGLLWGFILHPLFYALVGRWREVRPLSLGLAGLSVAWFVL